MRKFLPALYSLILIAVAAMSNHAKATRYMENLDRGVVAVYRGGSNVYVGWRMLGTEPESVSYNIYRNGTKINSTPVADSTNYLDSSGSLSSVYSISVIIDGIEQDLSEPVSVWSDYYHDIPLNIPEGVTTPDDYTCSYSPNDASVGDIDGDGQYEIILKWDPSNSKTTLTAAMPAMYIWTPMKWMAPSFGE